MNENIESLYQLVLLQMAADSYLGNVGLLLDSQIRAALVQGNNRFPPDPVTGGVTRFAGVQADELLAHYEIIHQLSDNPASGQPTTMPAPRASTPRRAW